MKTKIAKLALGVVLLASIAAPRFAAGAVVVAEPTGDADPAFLAELKASLETVAAEAPAELNAELKSSATLTDAGVELVVEYVPFIGAEPIRETRTASRASASAQARAMARGAMKTLTASNKEEATGPLVVGAQEKTAAPPPPPLPEKYDRKKALRMTVLPTVLSPLFGAGIFSLGFLALGDEDGEDGFLACAAIGLAFSAYGLIFGPMTGYFYVGRTRHALAMMGLRLAVVATIPAFIGIWISSGFHADGLNEDCAGTLEEEKHGCNHESSDFGLVATIISASALVVIAYTDAFLVGRAADRANAQWRESQKVKVQVAPVAWSNGNGDGTFGLAVSGAF